MNNDERTGFIVENYFNISRVDFGSVNLMVFIYQISNLGGSLFMFSFNSSRKPLQ